MTNIIMQALTNMRIKNLCYWFVLVYGLEPCLRRLKSIRFRTFWAFSEQLKLCQESYGELALVISITNRQNTEDTVKSKHAAGA